MNLEFYIRLRDMVTGGLAKMAETATRTTNRFKRANDTLAQSYDTIRGKIAQLESTISRSTSIRHIREARQELERLNRLARVSPGNIGGGGGGSGFFGRLLPALGIAGALTVGGNVIGAGFNAQARQVSFEVMAGKEKGTLLNEQLTKYAQDSIYGSEVYQNAQTMMAFGIAPENVMGDIKMLGDIAMGNKDRMGRLALAYSQVAAAGKLMGQDLLQFVNAGFNPLQIISEKTGVSLGELRKRVEEGQISFEQVREAFLIATSAGGRFFEMTKKIEETDFGKWEAFKGQLDALSTQIGGALAPAMGTLISYMSETVKWIQDNLEWLKPLAVAVAAGAAAYWLYTSAVGAGTLATWLLNAAMYANPVGLVIALIVALVAALIYAWNNFEGFRTTLISIWEVLKVGLSPLIDYMIWAFNLWKTVVLALWDVFQWVFDRVAEHFKTVFGPIIETIKWLWNTATTALGNTAFGQKLKAAWERGQQSGSSSITDMLGGGTAPLPGFVPAASGLTQQTVDSAAGGVINGGPRTINISINKLIEKIDINSQTIDKGVDELEQRVTEALLRVLNSGATVQ